MITHKEKGFERETEKILLLYHTGKISKIEFERRMRIHMNEPPSVSEAEEYFREEKK